MDMRMVTINHCRLDATQGIEGHFADVARSALARESAVWYVSEPTEIVRSNNWLGQGSDVHCQVQFQMQSTHGSLSKAYFIEGVVTIFRDGLGISWIHGSDGAFFVVNNEQTEVTKFIGLGVVDVIGKLFQKVVIRDVGVASFLATYAGEKEPLRLTTWIDGLPAKSGS